MMNIIQEYSNHIEEIFKHSYDYIYLHDKNGNIIDVNEVIVKNLGYSKKEILNMKVTDFLIEEVSLRVSDEIRKTIETGVVNKPKTYKVKKKDGTFVYVEASAIPLKRNGKFYAILGIGHDVTAYVELEQKLKESEEKYYHLFNKSPYNISLFDIDGNLIETNGTIIRKLAEYAKMDFRGQNFIEIASHFANSKEIIQLFIKRFKDLREGKTLNPINFFILTKNGRKIWLHWQSSKVEINDKAFIQVIIEDITEKKEKEQQFLESEEEYRLITENANDLIRVLNDKFEIEFVNESAHYTTLGYLKEELLGKTDIFLNHPDDYTTIRRFMRNVFKNGEDTHESRNRHKKGHWIWFEVKAKMYKNERGCTKYLIISRDITERKKSEHILEDRAKKLELLNEIIIKASQALEIEVLLEVILSLSIEMMDFDGGGIYLIKENPKIAELICHKRISLDFVENTKIVPIEEEPYKTVFIDKEPLLTENYSKIRPDLYEKEAFLSVASVPLYSKEHVIGALNIASKRRYFFTEEEKEIFKSIGSQIGTAIEKIRAEQALKESEEKFRAITEQSFMSIMVLQDGLLKYFNERLPKRIGYSTEEIKNWGPNEFEKIIHPEDRNFVMEQARKKQEGNENIINNYKYRSIRKDGEIRWVENFSKTINYGGRLADLVMSIDITDKLEAEQALKESEEKFRTIAEQSFMGIIIIQNGKLNYLNNAISKISGFPIEEIKNWSTKDMLQWIYPDDLPNLIKRLKRNKAGKMSSLSHNSFRVINKNGETRWLEDYTSKIIYQGKPANLISIVDITDKIKAEQLIIEENKRLLELHELRKDIITRVSHELKTPMTSIYGANQILLKLYINEIGEEALKYIEIGHRGCIRLKQLIDNLLDVSRLDAKKFNLKIQKENIVELIVDCVKDMKYLAANRQLKMKLELPNELYFNLDRLRFRQVLSNILTNAIKNTPKEGEIFVNLIEDTEIIDIHIKDTGIGLTLQEKEKLFEKFGKIERYGMDLGVDIEGSGLGLYISKEIVELHGGQILVESEGRNKGSTFIIRLPKK